MVQKGLHLKRYHSRRRNRCMQDELMHHWKRKAYCWE